MKYRFETNCTMKEYNRKKYWIDSQIVRPMEIEASDVETALSVFQDKVLENNYIIISNNAIKAKEKMYRDTESNLQQVGYVITGKTDIGGTQQYLELWVEITVVNYPEEFLDKI